MKQQWGDDYIECSHCHFPGHTADACRRKPNNKSNKNENYKPLFNGGKEANITEYEALSSERSFNDPFLWSVDSACNVYLTPFQQRFTNYTAYIVNDEVKGLSGNGCRVHGVGSVELEEAEGTKHTLHNVLHVPDAQRPLLSLTRLMRDDAFTIHITWPNDPSNFRLISSQSGINLPGRTINDLFHVWELRSHQLALLRTRGIAKRRHNDDDQKDRKSEKAGTDNFYPESPDLQPIRS
jgi:hypothetical protein